MQERRSDQHAPRVDEALDHDTESMTRGAPVEARADEGREQEGPADGEPTPDSRTTVDDLEVRSEIARHVQPAAFPTDRDGVLASAEDEDAPDDVLAWLRSLPGGRRFSNVEDVWQALGGEVERRR